MKIYKYISCILIAISSFSCDDYLDIAPDNIATIDYAFRDKIGAEKFLATCYNYMPRIGDPYSDPAILGSDENWTFEAFTDFSGYEGFYIKKGLQTSNNPYMNYWDGLNRGKNLWEGIRNCNIFLDNVDKVGVQLDGLEKEQWKAEVKVLKAFFHYYLMKMYGPIPLMRTNISIEATTEEVRVFRDPWDECVDYVVKLVDEAVPYLPLKIEDAAIDMGRITQPIALSLKAAVLVTSASPLFNGNEDYKGVVDKRGIKLFTQDYDAGKWQKAAVACKNAIDTCLLAGHDLYKFEGAYEMSDTTKLLNTLRCVYSDRFNKEMIWCMTKNTTYDYQCYCTPYFTMDMHNTVPWWGMIVPTFRMAELFYSNNGVPIDEDESYDFENRYKVATAPSDHFYYIQNNFRTAKLNMNREPRFYANLAFDGAWWWGNGRFKDVGTTPATEAAWPIKMKQGQPSGQCGSFRYSITGYWGKKQTHLLTTVNSSGGGVIYRYGCPIIRLADLYLLYAEALNESNEQPTTEVYEYVDKVRNRAGLKGVKASWSKYSKIPNKPATKEGMREIIHQERMIELCFESKRFWDLRRWKEAYKTIPGPIEAWNIEASTEEEYYQVRTIDNIDFTSKEYLWPIRTYSIRVNRNLVQNPFWE